tara:strand:+ start:17538 stop:18554 length:1017 start_codon:yes stop_codon:yes gene_type:complete
MAFLDNSGDIILDAVLTETGRRKMANGDFSIVKFALGDDEIDYALYNKSHPSGSAYYDLEILQTPIFEACTQINAGINYGLLATTATDLLYLPVIKINELTALGVLNTTKKDGMYYVTDNSGDTGITAATSISTALDAGPNSIEYMKGASAAAASGRFVLCETGLDTGFGNVPIGTSANRMSYLAANGLLDTSVIVYYDSRFLSGISGTKSTSTFGNQDTDGEFHGEINMGISTPMNLKIGLDHYVSSRIHTVSDTIYWTSTTNTEERFSVIGGPRGVAFALSPIIKSGLSAEYTLYGTTTSGLLSGATTDYIDTTVYVQGAASNAMIQIPIRIIKIS